MPMISYCCCTKNLRLGTIVCGVWSLISGVFSIGLAIGDLQGIYTDPQYFVYKFEDPTGLIVLVWINLVFSFFTLLCAILLLVAVTKNKAKLMIPWMVMVAMATLLDAAQLIFNILLDGLPNILIAFLLTWITFTLINIYCELCVLSHYQEVKLGRGHRDDYLGRSTRRQVPEVQHVHISDGPINYVQSQHTVYSFHSQMLFEDEPHAQNGKAKTALSNCNGRVLELRPVSSVPSNMDTRLGSNGYTGSIEMKIIDSIPVTFDRVNNDGNSVEVAPVFGKRPRRFRTVSESAVVKQQRLDEGKSEAASNSLRNIAEREALQTPTNDAGGSGLLTNHDGQSASGASDAETVPLTSNLELHDSDSL